MRSAPKGCLVYRNGIDATEGISREINIMRPELSNAPWVADLSIRVATAAKARARARAAVAGGQAAGAGRR